MKPIICLTETEAAQEFAELTDAMQELTDELDLYHWRQVNASRMAQLEQHIAHLQRLGVESLPQASPEPPSTPEPAMQVQIENPHRAKLEATVEELEEFTARANNTRDAKEFKRLKNKIFALRFKIKSICRDHDLESPKIPDLPEDRFAAKKPEPGALQQPGVTVIPEPYTDPDPEALAGALKEKGIQVSAVETFTNEQPEPAKVFTGEQPTDALQRTIQTIERLGGAFETAAFHLHAAAEAIKAIPLDRAS